MYRIVLMYLLLILHLLFTWNTWNYDKSDFRSKIERRSPFWGGNFFDGPIIWYSGLQIV